MQSVSGSDETKSKAKKKTRKATKGPSGKESGAQSKSFVDQEAAGAMQPPADDSAGVAVDHQSQKVQKKTDKKTRSRSPGQVKKITGKTGSKSPPPKKTAGSPPLPPKKSRRSSPPKRTRTSSPPPPAATSKGSRSSPLKRSRRSSSSTFSGSRSRSPPPTLERSRSRSDRPLSGGGDFSRGSKARRDECHDDHRHRLQQQQDGLLRGREDHRRRRGNRSPPTSPGSSRASSPDRHRAHVRPKAGQGGFDFRRSREHGRHPEETFPEQIRGRSSPSGFHHRKRYVVERHININAYILV